MASLDWHPVCSQPVLRNAWKYFDKHCNKSRQLTCSSFYSTGSFDRRYVTFAAGELAASPPRNYNAKLFRVTKIEELDFAYRESVRAYIEPLFKMSPAVLVQTEAGLILLDGIEKCVAATIQKRAITALVINLAPKSGPSRWRL